MKTLRFRRRDEGATLVEYALGVALAAVVIIGIVNFTQNQAKDKLSTKGNAIGHPAVEGGVATTTTTTTTVPPASTTTTTAPPAYTGSVVKSCRTGQEKDICDFTLSPPPDAAATVTWTINPPTGYEPVPLPSGYPIAVRFTSNGSRTIQPSVDGVAVNPAETVNCVGSSNFNCS